jgi:hypothetical protein
MESVKHTIQTMSKHTLFITLMIFILASCTSVPETSSPDTQEFINMTTSSPDLSSDWWHPGPGLTWQWQLSELPVDTSVEADVFDIDLVDNDPSVIMDLHARGRKVICYISVGSWEDWRPDKDQFPPEILGNDYDGWPGERWLDIRRMDKLAPILRARLDLCKAKGFDAVEPDNMQIYDNNTGFPITGEDQLRYAKWLADEAHSRGLAIGMKNTPDQVKDLLPYFDFAITEDCFDQGWCNQMIPFIQAGKPVFAAEYDDTGVDFTTACMRANDLGFSVILKHRLLNGFRIACP